MKSKTDELFEAVAKKNNTTAAAVREEIKNTIFIAMLKGTEEQKEYWRSMSKEHTIPTPEEAILAMSKQASKQSSKKTWKKK